MSASPKAGGTPRERDTDEVADSLLPRAALLVRLLVRQVHNPDISRSEGEALVILSERARRVTELAELTGLAQPSMTALVRRLERRGWVRRESVAHDRRVVLIAITPAGADAVASFREQIRGALRADLAGLSDRRLGELRAAARALGELVEHLQR